jgi:DNA-binding CsgD family transcriptional regulator/HD-like signal output (HDOD) protein
MATQLSDLASASSAGGRAAAGPANDRMKSRLAAAFEAIERFPVLTASRDRIRGASTGVMRTGEIIGTFESDVGLMIAALRLANETRAGTKAGVATVPDAIEVIGPLGAIALAGAALTFDLLESHGGSSSFLSGEGSSRFELFRLHALSVQRAADQIAMLTGRAKRAELAVVSLLHDVGHLVISQLRPERKSGEDAITRSPEERLQDEREALRIDHALLGGVLVRRWRLPRRISTAIEQHHADDASGLAAHVSLADMIVHYGKGNAFSANRVEVARQACGLSEQDLDKLLREFPGSPRQPTPDACPLSHRELEVLRRLAEGKPYKEIAEAMQLSSSTVRRHLHNIYRRMEVPDRAQAVLNASRLGWI